MKSTRLASLCRIRNVPGIHMSAANWVELFHPAWEILPWHSSSCLRTCVVFLCPGKFSDVAWIQAMTTSTSLQIHIHWSLRNSAFYSAIKGNTNKFSAPRFSSSLPILNSELTKPYVRVEMNRYCMECVRGRQQSELNLLLDWIKPNEWTGVFSRPTKRPLQTVRYAFV